MNETTQTPNACALLPYGQVSFESFSSIVSMIRMGMPYLTSASNCTPHNRNRLLDSFLQLPPEASEWALWIDTDQEFTPTDVQAILAIDQPIVTGRTMQRGNYHSLLCYKRKPDTSYQYEPIDPDNTGLQQIDGCGFGFIKVHRSVHERLRAVYGFHQFFDNFRSNGDRVSHDLTWCAAVQLEGYQILVDNSIRIGHSFTTIRETNRPGTSDRRANIIPGIPYYRKHGEEPNQP